MTKVIAGLVLAVFVFAPEGALAETKKRVEPPTGKARAEQYAKVLKWCRQTYGGGKPEMVTVEWTSHYGQTTWWCRHY